MFATSSCWYAVQSGELQLAVISPASWRSQPRSANKQELVANIYLTSSDLGNPNLCSSVHPFLVKLDLADS